MKAAGGQKPRVVAPVSCCESTNHPFLLQSGHVPVFNTFPFAPTTTPLSPFRLIYLCNFLFS